MLPITLTTKTFSPAMLAKASLRNVFHIMISATIGAMDAAKRLPTDIVFVVDGSGSTGWPMSDTNSDVRMDKIKEAADSALKGLSPDDRIALVRFESNAETPLAFVNCDSSGLSRAQNAIWNLRSSGGTDFATGFQAALDLFPSETVVGRNRVLLFLTDGENGSSNDPLPLCEQLKQRGVTLYIAGLGVKNENEKYLQEMAKRNSVETNFRGLTTSEDVLKFFADVQAAAKNTAIKNARLVVTPVTYASVGNFELVTRGGQPNYAPAVEPGRVEVKIGDLGADEELDFYLNLNLVLPDDIKAGRRSFGLIELFGEVGGSGKEEKLRQGNIVVPFVDALPPNATPDPAVREMMGIAATSRELFAAANSTGAVAAQHVAAAAEQARKTVAFNRKGAADALAASVQTVQAAITSGDPNAAAQEARRSTRGFSAAERAAKLANMNKK